MRHNKGLETTAEPGGGPRQGRTSCVFPGSGEPGLIVLQAHPLPGARGVTRTTRGALVSVTDPGSVRTTDIPGLAGAGCGRGGQEAPARSLEREGAASSSAHRPSARSLPRLQSAARKPPRCDQLGGEGARGGERSGVKRAPRPPGLQWEELRARGEGSGAEGRRGGRRRRAGWRARLGAGGERVTRPPRWGSARGERLDRPPGPCSDRAGPAPRPAHPAPRRARPGEAGPRGKGATGEWCPLASLEGGEEPLDPQTPAPPPRASGYLSSAPCRREPRPAPRPEMGRRADGAAPSAAGSQEPGAGALR